MNKREKIIRGLAKSIIANGKIDQKKQSFIENELSRSEIRMLLSFLKLELNKQTVTITSAGSLPNETKKQFEKDFQDKRIVYNENVDLGAGLTVKIGDDVYDYSFSNYINQTIEKLRE